MNLKNLIIRRFPSLGFRRIGGLQKTVETGDGIRADLSTPLKRGVSERFARISAAAVPGLLAVLLFPSQAQCAEGQGEMSSRPPFSKFQIVSTNNIFNTKRSPRYVPSQTSVSRPRNIESFGLVGVMSYEKGPFAFFEGNSSDFQKVLKPDESIAGFKVAAIEPGAVKLASSTNEVELKVGMQLTRQDGGAWQVGARPENLDSSLRTAANWSPQPAARRTEPEQQPQTDNFPAGLQGLPDAIAQAIQTGIQSVAPGGQQPVVIQTPNGQNGQGAAAVPAPTGASGQDDVLQRLIRRRQQEQGNQ